MGDELFYSKLTAEQLAARLYDLMIQRGEQPEVAAVLAEQNRKKGRATLVRAIEGQVFLKENVAN